ncbi:MAG TPA: 1,4-alpha-glucan branching protein GlgB [Planctomycetota bacterium]|nr:1,4-alpha-glucan branching protein GlgB [Planctomycetota bacterium]
MSATGGRSKGGGKARGGKARGAKSSAKGGAGKSAAHKPARRGKPAPEVDAGAALRQAASAHGEARTRLGQLPASRLPQSPLHAVAAAHAPARASQATLFHVDAPAPLFERPSPRPSVASTPALRPLDIEALHRFPCTVGEMDLHLFAEGRHRRLWEFLGSHPRRLDGVDGTAFVVWAPNAQSVAVVGDFCEWDGRRYPLRSLGSTGLWELFVPGVREGDLYKYEILGADGVLRLKADPLAFKAEQWPGDASIVQRLDGYVWGDAEWVESRGHRDALREAMSIYEVHLASWRRIPEEDDRPLTYRELARQLPDHVRELGFTHVELMPVMEHPFGGSWGYQVTGYFAPTSRHGTPDDFRALVDALHAAGLGVILDWVPAHFPNDAHALARFDGTALYEHDDPRVGTHPDWDTLIFNFGRHEVRNFLVASALYWLREFHADGLRVDAVASMLYRDYSRRDGEWLPNAWGGRENVEAIEFMKSMNAIVRQECPGALMIAEESTAWNGVTTPPEHDGLGFALKWNLGWMHDSLAYFGLDPVHRRWHHDQLTFAMLYESSERFLDPLSHDEVVHGKGSLLSRMPGDEWQKFANLRTLLAYQHLRPGKKLNFMGTELAPPGEWDHDHSLPWHLAHDPPRRGLHRFLHDLLTLYRAKSCLWSRDPEADRGFRWIDCSDKANSVVCFERHDDAGRVLVLLNLTPVPRNDYRVGAPLPGAWRCIFSSDAALYGGSDYPTRELPETEPQPWHGEAQSLVLELPPLSAVVYRPE